MNKIIICGRLVRQPELKTINTGTELCEFTVAVDRRVAKNAEKVADYFDCTAWEKSGVFVNTYFHKGDGITVEGKMESRKYTDKEGKNRTAWGVRVDNVEFAIGKSNRTDSTETATADKPSDSDFEEVGTDDDLPF